MFNSVWYPSYEYDLPILGVDLISLGKGRILSVIDFQPITTTTEYSDKYISPLSGIREKYPDLHGTLSGKIYDDTSFFSKNLLFGRFTDETKVNPVVLPAFENYLDKYLNMMDEAVPNYNPQQMDFVKHRQTCYDEYSALKDPAVGLFDAYFGKQWSVSFVHDFLFTLSKPLSPLPTSDESPEILSEKSKPKQVVHNFKIDMKTGSVNVLSRS